MVKPLGDRRFGAGSSSPEIRANKPPVVKVDGNKKLTAKVGQPLTIVTTVTDDGVPKPRSRSVRVVRLAVATRRRRLALPVRRRLLRLLRQVRQRFPPRTRRARSPMRLRPPFA